MVSDTECYFLEIMYGERRKRAVNGIDGPGCTKRGGSFAPHGYIPYTAAYNSATFNLS